MDNVKIKKNITIFYSRIEEKQIFLELEKKLKLNGFFVRFSKNLNLKAEIGIYCQNDSNPSNSKYSVIFLGGMDQQGDWPNIWKKQPWNKFDLGFLPEKIEKKWFSSSTNFEARTRKGVFKVDTKGTICIRIILNIKNTE